MIFNCALCVPLTLPLFELITLIFVFCCVANERVLRVAVVGAQREDETVVAFALSIINGFSRCLLHSLHVGTVFKI
mgnify:CR=1 FL=1